MIGTVVDLETDVSHYTFKAFELVLTASRFILEVSLQASDLETTP